VLQLIVVGKNVVNIIEVDVVGEVVEVTEVGGDTVAEQGIVAVAVLFLQ
jgi:hypothetical protein